MSLFILFPALQWIILSLQTRVRSVKPWEVLNFFYIAGLFQSANQAELHKEFFSRKLRNVQLFGNFFEICIHEPFFHKANTRFGQMFYMKLTFLKI